MRNLISTLLLIAAGILVAVAAYMYWEDRQSDDDPPPPPSVPGQAELKNVFDVLNAAGLETEYGRQGARAPDLTPAGQQLIVEGQPLYVFIYSDPESREAETAELEDSELTLVDSFGDPLTIDTLTGIGGSNVYVVLVGGDEQLGSNVETAISTLP